MNYLERVKKLSIPPNGTDKTDKSPVTTPYDSSVSSVSQGDSEKFSQGDSPSADPSVSFVSASPRDSRFFSQVRCCDCIHGTPALAGSAVSWHSCAVPKESRWHGQWGLAEHYCESWVGSVAEEPADPLAVELARLGRLDLGRMLEGQLTEPQWDRFGDAVAELAARLDAAEQDELDVLLDRLEARQPMEEHP